MKKSLILFLAFLVVGALAYAAEPATDVKVDEFKGDASVTLGFDIDQGMAAFTNAANASIRIQIATSGDKTTTGDGIWGELKIKTDGDPVRIKADQSGFLGLSGYKVVVDVAKLNFGTIAYLGIKQDSTQLNYSMLPDEAAGFFLVDTTKYYGQLVTGPVQLLVDNTVSVTNVNAVYGVVLGITPAGIGNFTVDVRSVPQWTADGVFKLNEWGVRAQADITAIANLTAQAGVAYSFGPGAAQGQDFAVGGKVAYKVSLGDPMFVQPKLAADVIYNIEIAPATSFLGYSAQAGVLFGWGAKSKWNQYFSPDKDYDYGYYPGIAAGVIIRDADMATAPDPTIGANVSVFAGSLVPNLRANAVLEILNVAPVAPAGMQMGFNANLAYDIAMAPMTITPSFGAYYYNNATTGLPAAVATDIYVKAGLDIAKIFPNTTLSFLYQSNDFNGGVGNVATGAQTMGMFATTLKISF